MTKQRVASEMRNAGGIQQPTRIVINLFCQGQPIYGTLIRISKLKTPPLSGRCGLPRAQKSSDRVERWTGWHGSWQEL